MGTGQSKRLLENINSFSVNFALIAWFKNQHHKQQLKTIKDSENEQTQEKAQRMDEKTMENFILTPELYEDFLSDSIESDTIEIIGSEPYETVDVVGNKRLVLQTRKYKQGETFDAQLVTIMKQISSDPGTEIEIEIMQNQINNTENNTTVQFELVHYHKEGGESSDFWISQLMFAA